MGNLDKKKGLLTTNNSQKAACFLEAARVPLTLEQQRFGEWAIHRHPYTAAGYAWTSATFLSKQIQVPVDLSNIHIAPEGRNWMTTWDTVMEDSLGELRRHLPIWLAAKGRVLVTGLGLGCVVRGLLASPCVDHVDVIEKDPDIHAIVGEEFTENTRVTLHLGDALTHKFPSGTKWNFAWHDLYTPKNEGLQLLHAKLFRRYQSRVTNSQGAWQFPRSVKRLYAAKMGSLLGA